MSQPACVIRAAEPADQPAVERLVREAYTPYIARIGRPPGPMLDDYGALIREGSVHLLDDAGAALGLVVLIDEPPSTLLLDNVAVDPGSRGKGLGRRLIDFAERQAGLRGRSLIRLYTHALMSENIGLYAKLGFSETHRAWEDGFDRVYMQKAL